MTDNNEPLTVEHVTTLCGNGSCPTVYTTNRESLVVQGYETAITTGPDGQQFIEVPIELIKTAAKTLDE